MRSLFQFSGKNSLTNVTKKEYMGRKLIGYGMENMYDIVADVSNYKTFLPFCKQSNVTSRTGETHLTADLVIGFPPVVESYTSHVSLLRPKLVKAVAKDCKIFKHMLTLWKFAPGLRNNPSTCIVDFFVTFEFRSILHSQLTHVFFNEIVRQMEGAFYEEAKRRHGPPAISTRFLEVNLPVNR